MKKTWKNFALIGLVAIFAIFSLTACDGDGGGGGGGGGVQFVDGQPSLGAIGPGGGKIFYHSAGGFTMTDNSQLCHYLEAAPNNQGTAGIAWASSAFSYTDITGINETAIGTGRRNTTLILATDANAPAAKACKNYTGGGKDDWFLPSLNELVQLYENRTHVGNLGINSYWSSSQYNLSSAWLKDFMVATQGSYPKDGSHISVQPYAVRAIRAF